MPPQPNRGPTADGEGEYKGDQLRPINMDVHIWPGVGGVGLESLLTQAKTIK